MAAKYSKIPANTFNHLGVNAGLVLSAFDPATGTVPDSAIIAPTTGGVQFQAQNDYNDWGEDIDNCPKNTKELKRFNDVTVTCSGTFVALDALAAARLVGHADWTLPMTPGSAPAQITPRSTIEMNDFNDLWIVGDYSDINTGTGAGYIAIHLMNTLSTGGFQIQTTDKEKMQFAFEFTAHFSLDAQDTVPYEIYIKDGTSASAEPEILLDRHSDSVKVGSTLNLRTTRLTPPNATVTWTSSATGKASVNSSGKVTGVATGSTIITASITEDGVTYTDTCTIVVVAAS